MAALSLAFLPDFCRALTCGTTKVVKQAGGGDCTSITQCVGLIPATLTGNFCIDIQDSATYNEQVTVQNIANAGYQIVIGSNTGTYAPVVDPPASSIAAFQILNASVTIEGLSVAPTNAMTYGIEASSAYVTISSVNVQDAGGKITKAGVSISSWSAISYSSVTVGAVYGFWLPGSTMTTVSYSSAQADGGSALYVNGASSNTFSVFFASDSTGHSALLDAGAQFNTITQSTFTSSLGNYSSGFYINGASSNTITESYIYMGGGTAANALGLSVGSVGNTISLSTAVSGGNATVDFNGASSNTVSQSLISGVGGATGALFENAAVGNVVTQSTMTSSASYALYLNDASSNTVTRSYGASPTGRAVNLYNQSDYNTISVSTFTGHDGIYGGGITINSSYNTVTQSLFLGATSAGAGYIRGDDNSISLSTFTGSANSGLVIIGGSSNTVSGSYMAGGVGLYLYSGDFNAISLSTMTGVGGGSDGLAVLSASSNTISQCFMSGVYGAFINNAGSSGNTILLSTMTGSSYGLWFNGAASSYTIAGSYMQGGLEGVRLNSTGTAIGGSIVTSLGSGDSAIYVGAGSVNLTISSTTILRGPGGSGNAGIYFFGAESGLINLSSNTINPGYQYGIYMATQAPNAAIWITSNTIMPTVTSANDTYGLYFNGLPSGATVQNNAFVWRDAGSQSGRTAYGLYAHSVTGLNVDHNRISEPGLLTAGSFIGAYFTGAQQTAFKFNDVNSTGTSFTNAYLVQLAASTVTIRDNVFLASMTVTGSSASITADAASGLGGANAMDYNDWFSSNSADTFIWGAAATQFSSGWFGQDAHSIASNPLWFNTVGGVEDFHPQSKTGRYDPGSGTFVTDSLQSPTIDAGDPAEDFGLEPAPNDGVVNQGSYGDTAQASESPPSGCGTYKTVKQAGGGDCATISACVNLIPATLTGDFCIDVQDGATYNEQVTVQNINTAGHRIKIGALTQSVTPTVNPPASSIAAFQLLNDSVTIAGIDIVPSNAITYGVNASSANISMSSVNVQDAGGKITKAGISISSQSTISYSSVTVGAVYGFWLPGSTMTTVSYSSAQADGGSALYVNGASSNTFSVFFASDSTGNSALLDAGARFNTITLSTFTNYSGGNNNGFYINGASSNTVTRSYIYTRSASSNANTLGLSAGSLSNTISLSTAVNNCSSGGHAILFNGASSNTVSQSFIYGIGGGDDVGMFLENGANGNAISRSTVTSNGYYALELSDASTNTITQSYGSSQIGAYLLAQSDYNTISLSTFTSTSGTFGGLYMTASSYNTITQSFLTGVPQGAEILNGNNNTLTRSFFSASGGGSVGVFLSGANGNTISQSTMTTASGGAYGLELSNASSNTITQSYGSSIIGAYLLAQSDYNTISLSTFTGTSGTYGALYMTASSANVVTQAFFTGGAAGVEIAGGGDDNVISLSTMTGSTYGLFATGGSSNTIDDSYMQGNWGAYLTSTQTTIGGSVLVPTAVNYSGLVVGGGSVNFAVSSTTILAGPGGTGAGIYFFAGTSGLINLSSNTISSSYQYGIYLATQASNAAIWITSNTIMPTVTSANDTYGLYFNGLPSGATVQNNAFVWRDAGSQSGRTAYGLYAHSVTGLNVDHNRISEPGLLTAGSFIGAYFTGAQQTAFKFNDVNSTGTSFTNAYLVQLAASTVTIRDNVFLASMTVSGSSASLTADALSGLGGADGSDYNDWFSSNSANTFIWGSKAAQFSNGWFGADGHSIAANPLWFNAVGGVEDFHPKSGGGRYDPNTGTFVVDAAQSPTIDAGDPAEAYGLEPALNGALVNQGSYGDTAQASKTLSSNNNCPGGYKVVKQAGGGDCATISQCVALIPATLLGNYCIDIKDNATYNEQVTVQNVNNNGYQVVIGSNTGTYAPAVNPPAASTAAFQLLNASVTIEGVNIAPANAMTYGVQTSSAYITISSVNVQDAGGKISQAAIAISSFGAVSYSSVTAQSVDGIWIVGSSAAVSYSTFTGNSLSYAVYVNGASSAALTGLMASGGSGVKLDGGASYDTVALSTCIAVSNGRAIDNMGSYNTFTNDYAQSGVGSTLFSANGGGHNTVSGCTLTSSAGTALFPGNNDQITNSFVSGSAAVYGSATNVAIAQSTITNNNNDSAVNLYQYMTLTGDYIQTAQIGVSMSANSSVTASTIAITDAGYGIFVGGASDDVINGVTVSAPLGGGVHVAAGGRAVVVASTLTSTSANLPVVFLDRASTTTISNCYIAGSTAVYVSGSTGTTIGASVLIATGTNGSGVWISSSVNLTMSSNTLTGGARGAGVFLDNGNSGLLILSTNTIKAGARYGVYAATQASNAALWITSNTIVPTVTSANDTYGLYINGLASGATIENNAVVYRNSGSMGSGSAYAFYAQSAAGLLVDRNRFDQPGMLTGGSYGGIVLSGTSRSSLKFNDVNSTGTGLADAYGLQILNASGNNEYKDNVFLSSVSVTGSSATLVIDGTSAGLPQASDYNDWYSSNAYNTGIVNGASHQFLSDWRTATGQDAHSIASNPLWFNVVGGVEDFHPKSTAGRYDPNTGGYVQDATDSPTIDLGDPAQAYSLEPAPNGGRVNQGSYGDTAQASESHLAPGCASQYNVSQANGPYTTIQSAVNAIPNPMTGYACVVIKDGATYPEQVTVQNFTNNGSSITIEADPGSGLRPVVDPPGGSPGAFSIYQASVNVIGLDIAPTSSMSYGIQASSGHVTISSVNVQDAGGSLSQAGIQVSSWSAVSYSSVTVGNAHGFWLPGSTMTTISYSTATNNGGGHYSLYVNAASSNTFTRGFFNNSGGASVFLDSGSAGNVMSWSTATALSTALAAFSAETGSSSNTVTQSYLQNLGGRAGIFDTGTSYNAVTLSSMAASTSGSPAFQIRGSSYNTIGQSFIKNMTSSGDDGLQIYDGSIYNMVSQTTVTIDNSGGQALDVFVGAASNTITRSYLANKSGTAVDFNARVSYNTLSLSTAASNAGGQPAFLFNGSSYNVVTQSFISNTGGGHAVLIQAGSMGNTVSLSTALAASSGNAALAIQGGADGNAATGSYFYNSTGKAINVQSDAASNTISLSTAASSVNGGGTPVVEVDGSTTTLSQDFIQAFSDAQGVNTNGDSFTTIALSTMIAAGSATNAGVNLNRASSATIASSYIQGPNAIYMTASSATAVNGNILVANGTGGAGIGTGTGGLSAGLSASSNTILGEGSGNQGLTFFNGSLSGLITLSTNTIQGCKQGVYVETQAAAPALWITSNTIIPTVTSANDTYGLYINGLTSGATIQNNGIYYRHSGSMGSFSAYAIYAQSASGLNFLNNRVDQPGMITGGGYVGVTWSGTTQSAFKFNDVNSTGTGLANAYLVRWLDGSINNVSRDNVFLSSVSVTGSSATLVIDGASASGNSVDYNDYFSSNSYNTAILAGTSHQLGASWHAGVDVHSITSNPLWFNAVGGVEDFHPKSTAGRYDPNTAGFVDDGADAPTIDAADPAEDYSAEPSPNGFTANQGSYGDTTQASKSAPVLSITLSSSSYDFGTLDPRVAASTISVSSVVVTNSGNVTETYELSATTTTAGSVWTLGTQRDVETPVLQGLFNSVQPVSADFEVVPSTLTDAARTAGGGGGNYAGDENGAVVPVRAARGFWYQFTAPTSTIYYLQQQQIQVTVTATTP